MTDHFWDGPGGPDVDPADGEVIELPNCTVRQVAFTNTLWRSNVRNGRDNRLRGGARVFEIVGPS